MRPEDIIQLLRAQPFAPFRVHISDGTAYDIKHPDLAIVERSKIIIGVSGQQNGGGPVEKSNFAALIHVTRLEPLNGQSAPRKESRS